MIKTLLIQVSNDPYVNTGYKIGYDVGHILGKILPYIIWSLFIYWGIQYLKNRKSNIHT